MQQQPISISATVEQVIGDLKSTCFCPESEWAVLRQQLTQIFAKHNKPELSKEDLVAAKTELEAAVAAFRGKHQRIHVYQDPFGF